ncbi:hypothetical protein N7481_005795 [Penicillium waksmanii]|uniref:uncharacterized protein n=1 Tax=Penicillium waksmanii TaxID=69791 RepID=UPI0025479A82|nr:uncharacterized protein N7481_005795 [Penicillium waksmanii]KAJ5983696.1 hypothetical protein N7481_005795 [Penicillium waksmanii]
MLQIEPLHQVFLNFYAAVSYELLGQSAHLYSSTKISFLNAALDCFANCDAVLPEPMPLPKLPAVEKTTPPPSPPVYYPSTPRTPRRSLLAFDGGLFQSPRRDSLVRSITRLIDISLWDFEEDDPFVSDNEKGRENPFMLSLSPLARKPATKAEKDRLFRVMLSSTRTPATKIKEPAKNNTTTTLIPSPLRVRKIPEELGPRLAKPRSFENISSSGSSPKSQSRSSNRSRPPPLPLRIIPATKLNIDTRKGDIKSPLARNMKPPLSGGNHNVQTPRKTTAPAEPTEEMTAARGAKIVRHNRRIETLRSQITININSIQQHVDHVLDIQRTRRSRQMQRSISFWSFDPIKSGSDDDDEEEVSAGKDREPILDEFGNFLVKETKAQRITRLRSEGWETVGLRSPRSTWKGSRYYQEFCAMVMNEMYLDR